MNRRPYSLSSWRDCAALYLNLTTPHSPRIFTALVRSSAVKAKHSREKSFQQRRLHTSELRPGGKENCGEGVGVEDKYLGIPPSAFRKSG